MNGHVVIVPSWPIAADAIVMTLAIEEPRRAMDGNSIEEGGHMSTVGKFRFCSDEAMTTIDENWEHTQLRVVRDTAMVVIRSPNWQCLVVKVRIILLQCMNWLNVDINILTRKKIKKSFHSFYISVTKL